MAGPATPALDPAQVQAARDAVLAAPEFQVERDLSARLFDWLIDHAREIMAFVPGVLRWVALVALLLLIVGSFWWIARPMWLRRAARGAGGASTTPQRARFATERARAAAALAEGRLADAVRDAWLAALALLDERGLSRGRSARTDWEHVMVGRRALTAAGEPLAALATAFQRSHFGGRPVERAEAELCLAHVDTLDRLDGLARTDIASGPPRG
jgi:hypothetical protein